MRNETLAWAVISAVVLYLVWLVVRPVISPILLALTIAYVTYPFHEGLSEKIGRRKSAFLLASILAVLSFLFLLGFVLWINDVKYQIVRYMEIFFSWLQSVTVSSPKVNEVLTAITEGVSTRIEAYITSYTYSIPKLTLEIFVMLFVYYGALINAEEIRKELYALLPPHRKEFGVRLIEAAKYTLDTLLKSWLTLSAIKGAFTALGFWAFGIAQVSGAIALGILTVFIELLPLIGGWLVWVPGVVYLVRSSHIALALIFVIYSVVFISPFPDLFLAPKMTIKRKGLNALISLLGIFGGLWAFGLVGIIIGPVSLGLLATVIEEWKSSVE
ncbi:AI-2E family transporter [Thermococcus profundus]|uniref:AI-2E family transporter n=1 Tax=Thermococcus profundus TaxID=49899 RepID=A0A2Z2ML93_THEPR|nr:AI-2E family transporter [Thermococcus profundus]ASJ02728.1 AI-2E family transporter [Thermococcus profundus]